MRTPLERLDGDALRDLERESIREFVETCAPLLGGRVLDYGCGKQPYRRIVERDAGGEYTGWDRVRFPGSVAKDDVGPMAPLLDRWDAILCTQMIQYVREPERLLEQFKNALTDGDAAGALVMTGPLTWPEVEAEDLHRFTRAGIRHLVEGAGFIVERLEQRAVIDVPGFPLALGWQLVARA